MEKKVYTTVDGNEAVSYVAYHTNEVIAIYPITPASPMGEWADTWASEGKENIWGSVPSVVEMQSEGGAAGAIHGALLAGSLSTTFTASQGLLLMIPNMFKIAGELIPTVFHVSARTVAAQALSIFGDHSDVMATRGTGFALLSSASVQEAMDFALIAQAASLESRIPFLHFFDGFRTSHEISKIELLSKEDLQSMIDDYLVHGFRTHRLSPDQPMIRGTSQNPDVFFQARESVNPYYEACPNITQMVMDKFARQVGRSYRLFEYHGDPNAERVLVLMGSGCETVHETVDSLNKRGERVGVIKVRLYRPFDRKRFVESLPQTTRFISVLDRTKEPGSGGEPLYLDCVEALSEGMNLGWGEFKELPGVVGGRYGLSSKEFTPAMINGVFKNLSLEKPNNHFTVGIHDDVMELSLPYDPNFKTEEKESLRALFFGLASDGSVGAVKNSIKIIGEHTEDFAQGYFLYDSKKAGTTTISHLRVSSEPIRSTYLLNSANFIGCHHPVFLERYDLLKKIERGGTFLLNTPYDQEEVWEHIPKTVQEEIKEKKIEFYIIDASKIASECGLEGRINTVMLTCFFSITEIMKEDETLCAIKKGIQHSFGKMGKEIVEKNLTAVDRTLDNLKQVKIPERIDSYSEPLPLPYENAPPFVRDVLGKIIAGKGDMLPVSAFPPDGSFPTDTAKWEKRNIAKEIPVWDPQICIQCGKCTLVCPHSAIRIKVYHPKDKRDAPSQFKSAKARDKEWKDLLYTLQVAPEDCTGCGLCEDVCPVKSSIVKQRKAINLNPQEPLRKVESDNWKYFLTLPEMDRRKIKVTSVRQQQIQQPLFEFSGACTGCGETPYIKLISQLFGDRALIANATGCSSIFGGSLPTTPWSKDSQGRGPAWANSLFEDNAEFGLGFRLSVDYQREFATQLLLKMKDNIGVELVQKLLASEQNDEKEIYAQRERVERLKRKLHEMDSHDVRRLTKLADMLVKKSVWIIGGDGWAYDIGFGGLDHVIASGRDVNLLVLDTEVYSNTGGQMSKSTPRGAVARFAALGKNSVKKDLGLMAMTYGDVYVASVAMGAKDDQTLKAFVEAEAYPGPSLIIAYSQCIAHGIEDMRTGMRNQKAAVDSGQWILYRYIPKRLGKGENPLVLDSKPPKIPLSDYLSLEKRFNKIDYNDPKEAAELFKKAERDVKFRWNLFKYLASHKVDLAQGSKRKGKPLNGSVHWAEGDETS
jgi:pyruvate-ferredoxin/flavodoxin oxidoreductase